MQLRSEAEITTHLEYSRALVAGSEACNYDDEATIDNGACEFPDEGLDCESNCLNDADGDGVCDEFELDGCTSNCACNYDVDATDDDGSWLEGCDGCIYETANFDANAVFDDGSCIFQGCMDDEFSNYNPSPTSKAKAVTNEPERRFQLMEKFNLRTCLPPARVQTQGPDWGIQLDCRGVQRGAILEAELWPRSPPARVACCGNEGCDYLAPELRPQRRPGQRVLFAQDAPILEPSPTILWPPSKTARATTCLARTSTAMA